MSAQFLVSPALVFREADEFLDQLSTGRTPAAVVVLGAGSPEGHWRRLRSESERLLERR